MEKTFSLVKIFSKIVEKTIHIYDVFLEEIKTA